MWVAAGVWRVFGGQLDKIFQIVAASPFWSDFDVPYIKMFRRPSQTFGSHSAGV